MPAQPPTLMTSPRLRFSEPPSPQYVIQTAFDLTPSTSCFAPSPLGISFASVYGVLTNPTGRGVNIATLIVPQSDLASRRM